MVGVAWGEWETEKIQIVKQLRARRTLSSLSSFVFQLEAEAFEDYGTAAGVRLWRWLTVMVLGKLQRSVEPWGVGEDLE